MKAVGLRLPSADLIKAGFRALLIPKRSQTRTQRTSTSSAVEDENRQVKGKPEDKKGPKPRKERV